MNYLYRTSAIALLATATALAFGLAGCGDKEQTTQTLESVAFHPSDECHVCGMIIADFPGPKGEAVASYGVKKFCSTAELLGWWLQPENRVSGARLYVHDMGRSVWEHPDDEHLIDATSAFYVIGISLKNAMGAPLASFASEKQAQQLAAMHGGRVLRFDEIDQALLQEAAGQQHGGAMHGHAHGHAVH